MTFTSYLTCIGVICSMDYSDILPIPTPPIPPIPTIIVKSV